MASANRTDRGQSEVRNGETEARQDARTNISLQRTEQQRERLTNVSPKRQSCSADQNPLKRSDLDDFVACYNPNNRHERKESDRFKSFTHEHLTKRGKLNLDIFWLKDESLEDSANLPAPDIIAQEIVEDLEAALSQFATIAADLKK